MSNINNGPERMDDSDPAATAAMLILGVAVVAGYASLILSCVLRVFV